MPLLAETSATPRLLLVSNRLPVSIKKSSNGEFSFSQSSGGLVTGLSGLSKSTEFIWYGWPGIDVAKSDRTLLCDQLKAKANAIPIFLEKSVATRYYRGFCNSILWPLLHYQPGDVIFNENDWSAYRHVTEDFAAEIAKDVEDGDLVWIHDYHLMLLPELLRHRVDPGKRIKIGFFLHTPFPSSEIYRVLPVREEILRGVLHSDLIGFHTCDYARHFLSSCSIVLGLETTKSTVTFENKIVSVAAFPIGIEPSIFDESLRTADVQNRITELEEEFRGKMVMVGVDRLDYVKGLPHKLRAFELFLDDNPDCIGTLVLIQIAVPTRGDVEEYQNLRAHVNELVGRINGKFGRLEYTPIHYMHQSISFSELVALYTISDCCIVSSTRDGMNLVSFEYIACQKGRQGSLILSEFAGSSHSLNGAIIVNPWNIHELARAIGQAYHMQQTERVGRYDLMKAHVDKFTSAFWGKSFVEALSRGGMETGLKERLWKNPKEKPIDWRSFDGEC